MAFSPIFPSLHDHISKTSNPGSLRFYIDVTYLAQPNFNTPTIDNPSRYSTRIHCMIRPISCPCPQLHNTDSPHNQNRSLLTSTVRTLDLGNELDPAYSAPPSDRQHLPVTNAKFACRQKKGNMKTTKKRKGRAQCIYLAENCPPEMQISLG